MATEPVDASGVRQAILEAALRGDINPSSLKQLLAHAAVTSEQKSLVELMLSLADAEGEGGDETGKGAAGPYGRPLNEDPGIDADVRIVDGELSDLRQANDTLASALGACPICWGGNIACDICHGRGRPGFANPDPELFRELVVPAVERVCAVQRNNRRARARRAGAGFPPVAEVRR
jgi:hypothetical protein